MPLSLQAYLIACPVLIIGTLVIARWEGRKLAEDGAHQDAHGDWPFMPFAVVTTENTPDHDGSNRP